MSIRDFIMTFRNLTEPKCLNGSRLKGIHIDMVQKATLNIQKQ